MELVRYVSVVNETNYISALWEQDSDVIVDNNG
jgi:hypothetical protein